MASFPRELTPNDLARRIFQWNLKQCAWGTAVLVCASLFWALTAYGTLVLVTALRTLSKPEWGPPWSEQDILSRGLTVVILLGLVYLGCSGWSPLFVREISDPRFSEAELPHWTLSAHWGGEFLLAIPCIAPALTLLGLRILGRCFSWNRSRIHLACRTYVYLKQWNDWAPYPKLRSQRQAVALLYHLDLVRLSYRFGKLEIRARR